MSDCSIEWGGATLLQVRTELEMLFGPLLGTYRRAGGDIPAFWVVGPNQVRPSWTATGIEAVLQRSPKRTLLKGGAGALVTMRTWMLSFTCFDTNQDLEEVALLAYRAFPTAPQAHTPQTDDTYERLTLELPDPVHTTPLPF